jgi:glycosyltransferase involved in cell wall biosynthesis
MCPKATADVSVIVPNYNNGRFLHAFLQSVINSTVMPLELIIIDDGSTDETAKVLASFTNLDFLKVIRFPENLGLTRALNAGLDAAIGKYIMRADPDDILSPERIERQFNYMETHPDTDVLGCNVRYFHHVTGKNLNLSNFPSEHSQIVRTYQKGLHGIQHPTAFMKRAVVQRYRYEKMFPGEDYVFFSTMARDGCRFASLSEPLYLMRVHPASITSNLKWQEVTDTFKIRDRIWETRTSKISIWSYYYFILFYRKYQLSTHWLPKYFYLLGAIISNPARLFSRLVRKP